VFLNFIFVLPLLPLIWTVISLDYTAYNNSSDTFLYLDIAKNILAGRGPVVSFNVYQYWTGIFYPATVFIHTGFSYILAFLYALSPSITSLILFNFVIVFFNLWLIFLIAKRLYKDEALGVWAALIIASSVSVEITCLRLLTEQVSLMATLFAAHIFIADGVSARRKAITVGILLSIGIFLRSSSVIYPLAFFAAALCLDARGRDSRGQGVRGLDARLKIKLSAALPYLLWPLCAGALYEAAVYWKFHSFFPQYPAAFKNYYLANFSSGGSFTMINLAEMSKVLFCILRVLIIFAIFRMYKILKANVVSEVSVANEKKQAIFLWLAVLQMAATVLFYPYMRIGEFQWTRFLLFPVVCLLLLAVDELKSFCFRFFPRTRILLFHSILAIVFLSNLYQSARVLEAYWQEAKTGIKVRELTALARWVRENTNDHDLVAVSEYIIGGVYLDRPTVVLPGYNTLTDNKLSVFIKIYKPQTVIFENTLFITLELERLGYKEAPSGAPGVEAPGVEVQPRPRIVRSDLRKTFEILTLTK
jgi:hypothetical protein